MNRRRRIKRRPAAYRGRKIQVNFVPVIVIICLSVCAGYLTAKYIVYPILGTEPAGLNMFQGKETNKKDADEQKQEETKAESAIENKSTETSAETTVASTGVIEDQVELAQAPEFAIQFGSYSTKDAAEKSASQLKQSGIKVEVVEKDGTYKVISRLFDTKEKAKAALDEMDASLGAFVTSIP